MEESKEKTDVGKKGTNRRSSSENTGYDFFIPIVTRQKLEEQNL